MEGQLLFRGKSGLLHCRHMSAESWQLAHVKSQREQIVPAKFKKAVAGHTQTPLLSAQGASQFVHQSDVEHAEQFGGQAVSHTPAVVVVVGKWNTPEHAVQYVALVEQPSQLVWQGSQTEMLR